MKNLFLKLNINIAYLIGLLMVAAIATGVLPRQTSFVLLLFWILYSYFSPIEKAVSLFVRNIPFFIALPITASFDNFNSWRVVGAVIFIRWLFIKINELNNNSGKESVFSRIRINNLGDSIYKIISAPVLDGENKKSNRDFWDFFWKERRVGYLIFVLFIFSIASLFSADYVFIGFKRIIYFANLLLIPIVIADLIKSKKYFDKLTIDVFWGAFLAVSVGFLQLFSTYILNFAEFMYFWADTIERNFYGHIWAEIAMGANTWFAYNMSAALKLRVFSVFPDSHSFPLFLLACLPFILIFFNKDKKQSNFLWIYFFLFFTVIILTGTRGIWAAFLLPLVYILFEIFKKDNQYKKLALNLFFIFSIFFISFGAAYFILQWPQFSIGAKTAEERADIIKRVSSIIDLDETSNYGRIQIWGKTLLSIFHQPFIGVGIGNFPRVLNEDIGAAKAGASAHNLYLNIAAEMGVLAGLIFLWLFWEIFKNALVLLKSADIKIKMFTMASVASLLWIYGYNLTDAALFDERAFLIFGVLVATILGLNQSNNE